MEALGAAASIITVIHLTHQISILCWDIHSRVQNAREDIIRIIDEINALRTILEALARLTSSGSSSNTDGTSILEVVAQLDKPLKDCESELQILADDLRKATPSKGRLGLKAIVWEFKEKDVTRRLDRLCRLKSTLQFALTLDQTTLLIESRTQTLSLRATVDDDHAKRLRRSIFDWLGAPSSSAIFNDAQKLRTANTGDWFLHGSIFNSWKSTEKSFLWLHGIPGCGKTVLCSSVIEDLHTSGKLLLHFFFDFSIQGRSTVGSWLRSWISQLLIQSDSIPSPLRALYDAHHDGFQQPSDRAFLNTLHTLLDSHEEAYLVIDALDECNQKLEFLEMIEEIAHYDSKNIHILITSRNEAEIADTLYRLSGQNVEIEGRGVNEDIEEHVRNTLLKDPRLSKWPVEIQAEITSTLTSKAGGMFRWATCQLDALRRCMNPRDLRRTLNSLPTTLNDTYARILANIYPELAGDALRILSWLCFAFQWPTFEEMADILAVDLEALEYDPAGKMMNPEDVLTICGSLVTRSRDFGGSLRLSHHSVREYLVSHNALDGNISSYSIKELESDTMICKICLIHLQNYDDWWRQQVDKSHSPTLRRPRLIAYCLNYWMEHFYRAGQPPELCSLAQNLLLSPSSRFLDWAWLAATIDQDLNTEFPTTDSLKPLDILLYYSALIGSPTLIDAMLDHGADINAIGGVLGTALSVAAYRGDNPTVEWLVYRGADVNAQAWYFGNALHAAAWWGWVPIVEFLLAKGANVNALDGKRQRQSALVDAIYSQYYSKEIVKLLLEAGADIGFMYGTADILQMAVLQRRKDIVALLIEHGADVNLDGACCLQDALYHGELDVADILIENGAKVNSRKNGSFGGSLNAAALGGIVALDHLINKYGVDCTFPDSEGRTALHVASTGTNVDVILRLLELGLKVNERDGKGWSVIHYAASSSTPENLKILLPYWEPEHQDYDSEWSPLHMACRKNQPEALDLLIQAGFKPTVVSTAEPEWEWGLRDLAILYQNRNLISSTGEIMHWSLQDGPIETPTPSVPLDWSCDGCFTIYKQVSSDLHHTIEPL
jgi:ankyrin repeat protein